MTMPLFNYRGNDRRFGARGFALPDLLVTVAVVMVLAAIGVPIFSTVRGKSRLATCTANLNQIAKAVLLYAKENRETLPATAVKSPPGWWAYKEQIQAHLEPVGAASSPAKVFACPADRGYDETGGEKGIPFWKSEKHNFTSYVFNGVNLPGMPNIAGMQVSSIKEPSRTLLVMEWPAHAPLSWHRSRTGRANSPFYNNAECVVAFVDGRVKLIKMYFDGINAAYTRDPIPGYEYKYSGD